MIHEHSQWVDRLTWACAGVSGVFFALSFWQAVALGVAILSGLMSLSLGLMRWHDRMRYGPDLIKKSLNEASRDFAREAGEK